MDRWTQRASCLLVLAVALIPVGCAREPPEGPSVLVVLIDTLRKDHLGLYGYARPTSSHIDALGAEGWVFESHIATASQTVPSTLSLMLSQYPSEHGFVHEGPGHFFRNPPLYPSRFRFLAEVFRRAGYATAGFVANPFLQPRHGFNQGFERYFGEEVRGERLTSLAVEWMGEQWRREPKRPFFLYVHYFDVHSPYDPPPGYRHFSGMDRGKVVFDYGPMAGVAAEDLAATIAAYDGEIAYVDDQIGWLLAALQAQGRRDQTIVVVTSDHGDEFLEHGGMGHGTSVYGELVRVPLVIVYAPALDPGRRVEHLTTHVDVAPTLLALAGLEPPVEFRGRSLWVPAPYAFAENGPWRAVYSRNRKLVVNERTGERQLFDLGDELDQQAMSDAEAEPSLLEALAWYAGLEEASTPSPLPPAAPWSPEDVARLQALGYAE